MKYILNKYHLNVPDSELLADLKKTAKKRGAKSISFVDYDAHGRFSSSMLADRFGSWNMALNKAGLKIIKHYQITEDALFDNLKRVWDSLGRQPLIKDMVKPVSEHGATTYINRFGSWRAALVAFVEYMKMPKRKRKKIVSAGKKHTQRLKAYTSPKGRQDLKAGGNNKSRRSITKAMRFEIFRRDNYKCSICGSSPAVNPLIILHFDHIVPLSKGGETTIENLQTLCSDCNLGKGAKEINIRANLKKRKKHQSKRIN